METRKLVKSGTGSYVISVPKNWLDHHSLKKGSLIYVDPQGENLLLLPFSKKGKNQPRKLLLTAKEPIRVITRRLIAAYISGYEEVSIKGLRSKEADQAITEQLGHLPGWELIEKQRESLSIRDLLRMDDITLPRALKQMDMTLRAMFKDLYEHREEISVEEFYEQDKIVNKLYWGISRGVKAVLKNELPPKDIADYYEVMLLHQLNVSLEGLGDHLKELAKESSTLSSAQKKRVDNMVESLYQVYEELMKAYYTQNTEVAYYYLTQDLLLYDKAKGIFGKLKTKDAIIVSRILNAIVLTLTKISKIIRLR
ncbi:MAG: AbrB/MazE/SpoVT family DNA-binding domain-containing protein [Nanoarchaeota archaeon]